MKTVHPKTSALPTLGTQARTFGEECHKELTRPVGIQGAWCRTPTGTVCGGIRKGHRSAGAVVSRRRDTAQHGESDRSSAAPGVYAGPASFQRRVRCCHKGVTVHGRGAAQERVGAYLNTKKATAARHTSATPATTNMNVVLPLASAGGVWCGDGRVGASLFDARWDGCEIGAGAEVKA